jgi:hypothetical protein
MFGEKRSISAALKRFTLVAAVLGSVITIPQAAFADVAAAAPGARDGHCDAGEFCLYPFYDHQGSVSDFTTSIPNYGSTQPSCYEFKGTGDGKGWCVTNNALSGYNKSNRVVRLYYNSNYGGTYIDFQPGDGRDGGLGPLDLNNASHKFL